MFCYPSLISGEEGGIEKQERGGRDSKTREMREG
jgi:hypothetical protein